MTTASYPGEDTEPWALFETPGSCPDGHGPGWVCGYCDPARSSQASGHAYPCDTDGCEICPKIRRQ